MRSTATKVLAEESDSSHESDEENGPKQGRQGKGPRERKVERVPTVTTRKWNMIYSPSIADLTSAMGRCFRRRYRVSVMPRTARGAGARTFSLNVTESSIKLVNEIVFYGESVQSGR